MCACVSVCERAREMSVTLVSVCMHASVCVTEIGGKRDLGASEDTGVLEMVGAWEKAGKRAQRKEQWWGTN